MALKALDQIFLRRMKPQRPQGRNHGAAQGHGRDREDQFLTAVWGEVMDFTDLSAQTPTPVRGLEVPRLRHQYEDWGANQAEWGGFGTHAALTRTPMRRSHVGHL
ncbi:MAG: hypothetical protein Q7S93_08340 [Phenylobacterium sp.]|uniref:hypothetical protein n=1 Tax=Phenylobacterium sp. TaxID=1871053 RepID=UPI0027160955|nr:hypothetical protein [Phenylobacterium sp.]MDO8410055.1 hypothetical protein [Phenylobacterium sp.]